MVRSMTGYGRASENVDSMEITAEIRSVNHRYFEFSSKCPRQYGFLDDKLKKYVASRITRGKVEVFVTVNTPENSAYDVSVNVPLVQAYSKAISQIADECGITAQAMLEDIPRYPDVLTVKKAEADEQMITDAVLRVLANAVDSFIAMRETEGEKMRDDVLSRCDTILQYVSDVERLSKESVVSYRDRLEQKVRELLDDKKVDESRLITETAVFADKIAVDEETVRLRSHIKQLKEMMSGDEAIGRKLDFLVQEMNRETNTIGSKSVSLEITQIVVDCKSEIEKIREQIQNIE